MRDHDAVARALDGIDTVVHFAAAVGVGQSMYEIEQYTSINAVGAAVMLEEIAEGRDRLGKMVVASSMSIYGEGRYRLPDGTVGSRPGLRPTSSSTAANGSCAATTCGRELEPLPTGEDKPLWPTSIYAVGKRDHEEMFLAVGRAYGLPDGGAPLLQRLRRPPGALESLHRRRCDLRVAAAQRQCAAGLRGRPAEPRLHPRVRHRRGLHRGPRVRRRRRSRRQCRHRRPHDHRSTWPTSSRAGLGKGSEPEIVEQVPRRRHPPLRRRHRARGARR